MDRLENQRLLTFEQKRYWGNMPLSHRGQNQDIQPTISVPTIRYIYLLCSVAFYALVIQWIFQIRLKCYESTCLVLNALCLKL